MPYSTVLSIKHLITKGDLLEFAVGKYEIVVANIVADIIMQLTRDIKGFALRRRFYIVRYN